MRTQALSELEKILEATNTKKEFNIVEDIRDLIIKFGLLKSKDFRLKLNALLKKYEESEITEIRNAVHKKAREGDLNAVSIYFEHFAPAQQDADEDDGLIEMLMEKDVFDG